MRTPEFVCMLLHKKFTKTSRKILGGSFLSCRCSYLYVVFYEIASREIVLVSWYTIKTIKFVFFKYEVDSIMAKIDFHI